MSSCSLILNHKFSTKMNDWHMPIIFFFTKKLKNLRKSLDFFNFDDNNNSEGVKKGDL